MAEGFGSKVFVFHAAKPITKFFHGEIHLDPCGMGEKSAQRYQQILWNISENTAIAYEGKLTPGTIARSITIEAASKRHDLIIMGASERSLLSSLLKGNPVEDVLRETPCDLIILKPRHED